jgi:hypothetical protein
MLREMALSAIRTSKLSKDYGLGRGLFELDLEVRPQEVFGYLRPASYLDTEVGPFFHWPVWALDLRIQAGSARRWSRESTHSASR